MQTFAVAFRMPLSYHKLTHQILLFETVSMAAGILVRTGSAAGYRSELAHCPQAEDFCREYRIWTFPKVLVVYTLS